MRRRGEGAWSSSLALKSGSWRVQPVLKQASPWLSWDPVSPSEKRIWGSPRSLHVVLPLLSSGSISPLSQKKVS